jgi:Ca-activated chloride channel homolog
MTLLSPWWLLVLVPVALLAVGYVVQQRRRSRYAVRFATLPMLARLVPRRPGWRRHLPASLLLLAFGALGLAAARPQVEMEVPRETATIVVAIDTSLSMQQTDVAPTRLDAATAAASQFIGDLPERFNVAVVTFSGTTAVLTPPTIDHRLAAASLQGLTLENRTAIGEGLYTSLRVVEGQNALLAAAGTEDEVPAHVVLLSDGRNTFGRPPSEAARAAAEAGVPVSTISYGRPPAPGSSSMASADTDGLGAVAEATGGTAYTAEDRSELSRVYQDIRSAIGYQDEPVEVTQYAAALALLAGLVAAALSLRWFVRLP